VCGDRVAYAAALASLEAVRVGMPALAIGAQGGDLLARVRRLVAPSSPTPRHASGWGPLTVTVIAISVFAGAHGRSAATETNAQTIADSTAAPVPLVLSTPVALPAPTPRTRATARVSVAPAASTPVAAPVTSPVPVPTERPEQTGPGSIVGAVMDAQGGRIPGATVNVRADIGGVHIDRSIVTNAPGVYQIAGLDPGVYDVRVSMPSFKTFAAQIQVGPGETRLNVRLELGGVTETITVRRSTAVGAPMPPAPPVDPRGPNDFLELAKQYYEGGRLTEAAAMTSHALDLMRGQALKPVEADLNQKAPVRIGGDIKEPRKVRDVKPVYPAGAAENLRGFVILEAVIGKDGSVSDARILRSVPGLNEAALDAVRQWMFTPTLLNGVPVEVIITVTVNFSETP
jgi:TonB family protein